MLYTLALICFVPLQISKFGVLRYIMIQLFGIVPLQFTGPSSPAIFYVLWVLGPIARLLYYVLWVLGPTAGLLYAYASSV